MEYIIIGLAAVFVLNLIIFLYRGRKNRSQIRAATEERVKAERNLEETKRRLGYEQEKAARYVQMQNKTLELYERARRGSGSESLEHDSNSTNSKQAPSEHDKEPD